MKKLLHFILIAVMIAACGMTSAAKDTDSQKLAREKLAVRQATYIADKLDLDKETTQKYIDAYCRYQQKIWELGSEKGLNTEQRLDRSQKILDLRKKFYKEYKKFLTEEQIEKAYRLEKQIFDRKTKYYKRSQRRNKRDLKESDYFS